MKTANPIKRWEPLLIREDRRFKPGNIQINGREVRGHPKTLELKRPNTTYWNYNLNPPIIVSKALGNKLRGLL